MASVGNSFGLSNQAFGNAKRRKDQTKQDGKKGENFHVTEGLESKILNQQENDKKRESLSEFS